MPLKRDKEEERERKGKRSNKGIGKESKGESICTKMKMCVHRKGYSEKEREGREEIVH